MRCRAEQSPQQIAYAMAGMMALSQSGYAVASDASAAAAIRGCGWQAATSRSTKENDVVASRPHRAFSAIPDDTRFQYLVGQWREESAIMSSTTEMVLCPSYQSIMAMGEVAVPLILRQLESEGDQPDNWFWALRHITGESPVPSELRGNRKAMAAIWLDWARGRYAW